MLISVEVMTGQRFCVESNRDWPCATRRVLMEFRGAVADLQPELHQVSRFSG